jgi:DMSO/TMAO reductase YedYZ molybdopterin-dependent catalytic subunit
MTLVISRRAIVSALTGLPVLLAAPFVPLRNAFAARFPTRTVEQNTFTFDPSRGEILWSEKNSSEPYRLIVDGLVEKPVNLSYEELRALPSVTQTLDFYCVEGWTIPDVKWGGFPFKELLKRVEPKPEAKYVIFHALGHTRYKPRGQDHYVESFELASLLDPKQDIIMVLDKDGKPLSHDRGAPLRVIAPYRLAYKSIKFVYRVEFAAKRQLGWWTIANSIYDWKAPVPQRRLRRTARP